jgi:hypothetical protein
MTTVAPVVLFVFARPDHTRRTLEALTANTLADQSDLIVYADSARNASEVERVQAVRALVRATAGFRSVRVIERETNYGLARNIIEGVTEVCNRYGCVIVIEDDLELSPSFLTFMNHALDRYANDEKVFQISGYMFDVPELKAAPSALFLPFTVSWGWATWTRAWDQFDPLATGWEALSVDKVLRRRFNLDGSYDYATMLVRQMMGLRDSWAVRWYWAVFKANGLVLFPPVSLVRNTGFDGSGTHGRGFLRRFSKAKTALSEPEIVLPKSVYLEGGLYAHVKKALWLQNGGWIGSAVDWIRRLPRH